MRENDNAYSSLALLLLEAFVKKKKRRRMRVWKSELERDKDHRKRVCERKDKERKHTIVAGRRDRWEGVEIPPQSTER